MHAARRAMGFEGLNIDGFVYFHDASFSQELRAFAGKLKQGLRDKIEWV